MKKIMLIILMILSLMISCQNSADNKITKEKTSTNKIVNVGYMFMTILSVIYQMAI